MVGRLSIPTAKVAPINQEELALTLMEIVYTENSIQTGSPAEHGAFQRRLDIPKTRKGAFRAILKGQR